MSSKKFNLTELLNQRSKDIAPQKKQGDADAEENGKTDKVSATADIYDLVPSRDNFYSVEDVQDLKQSIELLGMLQPLLVTNEEDGKWRIIAGHRRRLAIMQLVNEGKERFRHVPIMVKPTKNAILDRLALIMANRFREKTDWEKMTESIETEKLVQELKGQMDIPGRTRDLLAEIIETSPAQLGRYKAIYNNLAVEWMTEFRAGKIGISVIYEISQLEKEWQLQSLEVFREKGTLALPDIKEIKRQQEAAVQVQGQMNLAGIERQQDTQEATQSKETAEGGGNVGQNEKTTAEGEGEPKEFLCGTCEHNGECAGLKTHDSGCMGYEPREKYEEPQPESQRQEEIMQQKPEEEQQKEIMQQKPKEEQHEEIRLSSGRYKEIASGTLSFLLLKKDSFKVDEELSLPEYAGGYRTGRVLEIKITYIMEDMAGLKDNYCIIGFAVKS